MMLKTADDLFIGMPGKRQGHDISWIIRMIEPAQYILFQRKHAAVASPQISVKYAVSKF
jgi:hypothetical protein